MTKITQETHHICFPLFSGNLPHLSFIARKPEPLGIELKAVACARTGVMMHLELQRGKTEMRKAEYSQTHMQTAACALRLMKYSKKRKISEEEDRVIPDNWDEASTYLADGWFGSIQAVLAAKMLGDSMICVVKTCHAGTPRAFIEEKMKDWPAGSNLALQATVRGVDIVCMGYKYSKKKVLTFLFDKGAGSIKPGEPYVAKWKDQYLNTVSKLVPRPDVIAKYFKSSNKIDVHNQSRQHDLGLEKAWVTRCGYFRLNTTILGICAVDAWKTYRHHLNHRHRHHNINLKDFISILTKDLLENTLTRRAPLPHPSFNIDFLGATVHVPTEVQDPEVPEFEKLTQESVFGVPGEDPELEEALNAHPPARSVTEGMHGLRKIDMWCIEKIYGTGGDGQAVVRDVRRRKRGKCRHCSAKTPWYCQACSFNPPECPGRYWCCGPDVAHGKECQQKHDSEWVLAGVDVAEE